MQTLGERIRAARKEAGLTQQALAGGDFTPGFISQLENGVVRPSLRSLEVLARRLGKPLSYFVAGGEGVDPQRLDLAEKLLDAGRVQEAGALLEPFRGLPVEQMGGPRVRRLVGVLLLHAEEPQAALALLQEALEAAVQESPEEQIRIHNSVASALDRLGRWAEAEVHLTQALALVNSAGEMDPLLRLKVETNLAVVYCRLGRYEECKSLGIRLLQGVSQTGLSFRLGDLLQTLGVAHQKTGALEAALGYYRLARELYQLLGEDRLRAGVLQNEGLALLELGRLREGRDALAAAADLYRALGLGEQAAAVCRELSRAGGC